jgi:hypothetical protein
MSLRHLFLALHSLRQRGFKQVHWHVFILCPALVGQFHMKRNCSAQVDSNAKLRMLESHIII